MRTASLVLALAAGVHGASMGPQQVGWKDHYFRIHPSARKAAGVAMAKRKEAIERRKLEQKELAEKRKLMSIDNKYGPGYYYEGETSSEWVINGQSMNYADVDCDCAAFLFPPLLLCQKALYQPCSEKIVSNRGPWQFLGITGEWVAT